MKKVNKNIDLENVTSKLYQEKVTLEKEYADRTDSLLSLEYEDLKAKNILPDTSLFKLYKEFKDGFSISIEVYTTCVDNDGSYSVKKNFYAYDSDGNIMDDTYNIYKNDSNGILGDYSFMDNETSNKYVVTVSA